MDQRERGERERERAFKREDVYDDLNLEEVEDYLLKDASKENLDEKDDEKEEPPKKDQCRGGLHSRSNEPWTLTNGPRKTCLFLYKTSGFQGPCEVFSEGHVLIPES